MMRCLRFITPRPGRPASAGLGVLAATALLAASCTVPPAPSGAAQQAPPTPAAPASPSPAAGAEQPTGAQPGLVVTDNTWTDSVNPAAIPLGDGKVSTSPRTGYVDSCTLSFRGGGASHTGPWINTAAGTWDENTKPTVSGQHTWSDATYRVSLRAGTRVVTTNDLPVGQPTGTFPISPSDPAYAYDHNPNSIVPQNLTFTLPADPRAAASPSCTGLGPIGVTTDGVLLFNALDAAGRDAGAHEIQDSCHGHPDGHDEYHYHSISGCLLHGAPGTSELVGYALDGYGIYAEWNSAGNLPTNADLGPCHGRTSTVLWNGKKTTMYHYDVTLEYPYTIGCFHGTPVGRGPAQP